MATKWIILRDPTNNNLIAQQFNIVEERWNGFVVEFNGDTRFVGRLDTYGTESEANSAIRKYSKKLGAPHGC